MSKPEVLFVMRETAHAYADMRAKEGKGALLSDELLEAAEIVEELAAAASEYLAAPFSLDYSKIATAEKRLRLALFYFQKVGL